ncbi:MAG: hypothetical protein RL323_597 [Pseudomonadota bacterium]|jgi:beta-fructofuranosidase
MLRLENEWVWDFWLFNDGTLEHPQWHVWYLKAPKALGDESLRHWNVNFGHATSTNLKDWTVLGTSLMPAPQPAWDDMTVWTGSVIKHNGTWHLFYTGNTHANQGRRQRIGHAISNNGHDWQRVGNTPVLDLQPGDPTSQLYEEYLDGPWDGRAMRDPWVMPHPDGEGWLMFFTGRSATGDELNSRGVIGLATSPDLHTWTLQPPVYAGQDFGQLEVPQVLFIEGRWYCLFCNAGEHWSQARAAAYAQAGHGAPVTGTHYLVADHPLGPWQLGSGPFLDGTNPCQRYAGKLAQTADGWVYMAFDYWQGPDDFAGTLCDPIAVTIDAQNATLRLAPRA